MNALLRCALLLLAVSQLSGCFAYNRIGMKVLYREAEHADARTYLDVPYRLGTEADPNKHRLNLFIPEGKGWPTVLFIHGGGWDSGDRNLTFAGKDVYNNIGRFLAEQGIGSAVISYRLLPEVGLAEQIDDVATATAWVHRQIGAYGGDPSALFLMGHSAGGHLATFIATDPVHLEAANADPSIVCGVIPVSGAGFDMADPVTYELGTSRAYFERRFAATGPDWMETHSSIHHVDADDPPFLILYAAGEPKGFERQATLLHERLEAARVPSQVVIVPGENHARMILVLSRADKAAVPSILDFVANTRCR